MFREEEAMKCCCWISSMGAIPGLRIVVEVMTELKPSEEEFRDGR